MTRKHLMILVALAALVSLTACTREITTVVQENPEPSSCFECHSDQNTFMVAIEQQWSNSVHASGLTTIRSSSASCAGCHSSEGFLARVAGETPTGYTNPTVIHCFTCHAPHSDGNFNLRLTEPQTLKTGVSADIGAGNLCVACHQARATFDTAFNGTTITSSHFGPHHGPQGDLLFATNGYEYDGYEYSETQWHRTDTEGGCVNCHVKFVGANFLVGGHTFNMAAFLEPEPGIEQPTEIRNTAACVDCHTAAGWGNTVGFDYADVQTTVEELLVELQALLFAAGHVDATGHPIGSTQNPHPISVGEAGALWNFLFIEEDRSMGVHNAEYAIDLLESSIAHMESLTK